VAILPHAIFLWFGLDSWQKAKIIALFHLTGTVMKVFKLNQGSWDNRDTG
jgi:uncharacterized membrane protein YoaT (DUF817 family)